MGQVSYSKWVTLPTKRRVKTPIYSSGYTSGLSFHWEIYRSQCLMLSFWRLSWKCGFLQFLRLNLPENCSFHQNPWFSSKSTVFIKICSFHQNLRFSSKSVVFVKIRGFHQNPQFSSKSTIFAISLWAFKRTTSNVKWKTTCLER